MEVNLTLRASNFQRGALGADWSERSFVSLRASQYNPLWYCPSIDQVSKWQKSHCFWLRRSQRHVSVIGSEHFKARRPCRLEILVQIAASALVTGILKLQTFLYYRYQCLCTRVTLLSHGKATVSVTGRISIASCVKILSKFVPRSTMRSICWEMLPGQVRNPSAEILVVSSMPI